MLPSSTVPLTKKYQFQQSYLRFLQPIYVLLLFFALGNVAQSNETQSLTQSLKNFVQSPKEKPADFVEKSRDRYQKRAFIPFNTPRAEPSTPVLSPEQVQEEANKLKSSRLHLHQKAGIGITKEETKSNATTDHASPHDQKLAASCKLTCPSTKNRFKGYP